MIPINTAYMGRFAPAIGGEKQGRIPGIPDKKRRKPLLERKGFLMQQLSSSGGAPHLYMRSFFIIPFSVFESLLFS